MYDQLSAHFDQKQILTDIDAIALDEDFVRAIEKTHLSAVARKLASRISRWMKR
jgi:hypothetical protein